MSQHSKIGNQLEAMVSMPAMCRKPKIAHADPTWFARFKIPFLYGIKMGD